MESAEDPQASLVAEFYRKEARHLLRLHSVDDIERLLSTAEGLDYSLLLRALSEFRDDAAAAPGRLPVRNSRASCLRGPTYLRERNPTPETPSAIDTPEDLLQAAAFAPSALRAARFLQKHRHLLSQELLENHLVPVLEQLKQSHGNPPQAAVRLLLCFVLIAKMLGDREPLGKFIMLGLPTAATRAAHTAPYGASRKRKSWPTARFCALGC